ncbi:MAG: MFS transporter [Phycisphaerales bacterium]|nr:MFS transporter [Phycisphaerales bacterium]
MRLIPDRLNPFATLPRGREVWAWGMYDLANQSFQLLVDTLLLVIYFKNVVAATPARGEALWGPMVGAAMLLVVMLSPILGALADARAWKKRLLIGTGLLAVPLICALALLGPGMVWQTAALYITAKLLIGLGENFLGSFLPELSTPRTVGRISAIGWTMSYIGALLLLGITAVVVWGLGATDPREWRWLFVLAGVWFLAGMIPSMVWLHERDGRAGAAPGPRGDHGDRSESTGTSALGTDESGGASSARGSDGGRDLALIGLVRDCVRGLRQTVREARRYRQLMRFLGVFFVYSLGTNTAVFFLGSIGDGFGFGIGDLTLMALVMAATAGAAAAGAAVVQDRIGHRRMIAIMLVIWVGSTLAMAVMSSGGGASGGSGGGGMNRAMVWPLAGALGLALGGIGTGSRAMVGAMTPGGKSGEFFGLWGMVYKFAGVVGPVCFGLISGHIGRSVALYVLSGFFLAGLALLPIVNEREGVETAGR